MREKDINFNIRKAAFQVMVMFFERKSEFYKRESFHEIVQKFCGNRFHQQEKRITLLKLLFLRNRNLNNLRTSFKKWKKSALFKKNGVIFNEKMMFSFNQSL